MTARPAAPQPDLFAGPPPARTPARVGAEEQRLRDRQLDRFEALRTRYLEQIRFEMFLLHESRRSTIGFHGAWLSPAGRETQPWVSADDARAYFETLGAPPELSRNFLGQVFRRGGWTALVGRRVASTTAGSHRNELKLWTRPLTPPDRSPA